MTLEEPAPAPGGATDRRRLSANQEFFRAFDRGDDLGAFGPRLLIVAGWRLRGRLEPATLQSALDDVAARHEGLRTAIVRDEGDPHARLHPPSPVELTVKDLQSAADESGREHRAHEFINEVEAGGRLDPTRMPLLRAVLGRFDDGDAILVLLAHHTASDAWSVHLIMRDVAICYATRRGLPAPALPEARQYGEYANWQRRMLEGEAAADAREYWRAKLAGGKFLTLCTDRARKPDAPPVYSVHRFLLDRQLIGATTAFASSMHATPFMVLYACFNLLLHRRTGASDIIAPILTSGRAKPEFQQTVGPFFNLLPIRTDLSDCVTFRDLVNRTRVTLLEAYSHELPFREIVAQADPELTRPMADTDGVTNGFEIFQYPQALEGELIGDVRYTGLHRRLISASDTSEIPDGNLWDFALDPAGDAVGLVKFNSREFDQSTVAALVEEYRGLLHASIEFPDSALRR